ncbi:hypothetical protein ACFPZ0_13280 [Streptomonospora nanhaiensis]|uniref:Uncharacterized protein n=1 Tax=Streptomonospora nanhaiensis TaxID=1323731 RepID=A0A853BL34_9ACTN|nr:hypothetical protein [Streptomonospora nanhaiensis]MBV2363058.1 hypothetical protein [Streptomonospora nanhaiensis]MBX9388926.1 hypothetical protein [Streptomonospora nanhaiensis]NYI95425.1 hypothetical protein [Streptomonospora nanhaiensis]
MTERPDDAFEDRLRAILRAEADSVAPSPEALTAIRARTQRNSRFWALFTPSWLRPSLAVGAAALIAGSVLLGTPQVRDQILPQSLTSPAGEGGGGAERPGGDPGDDDLVESEPTDRPSAGDPPSEGSEPSTDALAPEASADPATPYGPAQACPPDGSSTAPPVTPSGSPEEPDSAAPAPAECDEPADPAPEPGGPGGDPGSPDDSTTPPAPPGGGDAGGDGEQPSTTPPSSSGEAGTDPVLETH